MKPHTTIDVSARPASVRQLERLLSRASQTLREAALALRNERRRVVFLDPRWREHVRPFAGDATRHNPVLLEHHECRASPAGVCVIDSAERGGIEACCLFCHEPEDAQ